MNGSRARATVFVIAALLVASTASAQRAGVGAPAPRSAKGAKVAKAAPQADASAPAASPAGAAAVGAPSDSYDELFQAYLQAARATPVSAAPNALWMAGLLADLRARHVNDLVTIHIVESVSAQGSADSSLDKNSSGSASIPSLFGLESKYPGWLDPTALASLAASTKFKGSGSTARTGLLTAVLTARVAEVLPNGDLGVEGVREIEINGDRQILVLTGVVRPADVGPGNVVASTAVGQMRVRYFGRGLIKDNLSPGLLVRILNKIF